MKRNKEQCLVCQEQVEEDDYLYVTRGSETMVYALCGEHAVPIARFLERAGLADRTSIPWRDALADKNKHQR
jgi:hypothetical protein